MINHKTLQDILPGRALIEKKNREFAGIIYEHWITSLPIFGDQVETLLENGFMVSMLDPRFVTIHKQLNPSSEKLHKNKQFWIEFKNTLRR